MVSVIRHIQLSNMGRSRSGRISDIRLYSITACAFGVLYHSLETGIFSADFHKLYDQPFQPQRWVQSFYHTSALQITCGLLHGIFDLQVKFDILVTYFSMESCSVTCHVPKFVTALMCIYSKVSLSLSSTLNFPLHSSVKSLYEYFVQIFHFSTLL